MQKYVNKHKFTSKIKTVAKVREILKDANKCKKIFFDAKLNLILRIKFVVIRVKPSNDFCT